MQNVEQVDYFVQSGKGEKMGREGKECELDTEAARQRYYDARVRLGRFHTHWC